jgi:hypothetical protein
MMMFMAAAPILPRRLRAAEPALASRASNRYGDPMSLSMYSASVPVFARTLTAMLAWLDKAQAHAEARGFSPDAYLALRLAPDMLPFTKQVQIACDMVKGCVSRLAGAEVPSWPDDEATLEQLRGRIRRTLELVQAADRARIDGSDDREIVLQMRAGERRFSGEDDLKGYVLPNVYFHATMTYALLREAGVELGKKDFLGA